MSKGSLPHLYGMNQKGIILLFWLLAVSIIGYTQVKKVYAYKQASIPGTIIGSDETDIKEENGDKKTGRKQNFNYWFYLSVPGKNKIAITGLWIDRRQHEIKSEPVTDLPVRKIIYTGLEKNDTIIMAPVTVNKTILVYPGSIRNNDSKYALSLAKTNELVIRYSWKGKTYFTTIRKITELAPDVRV